MYDDNRWHFPSLLHTELEINCRPTVRGLWQHPGWFFFVTGVAFSGAFSGSVRLRNKAYLSVTAQTNILSERVQPQWSECHFFNIINKGLGCRSVSFVKKSFMLFVAWNKQHNVSYVTGFFFFFLLLLPSAWILFENLFFSEKDTAAFMLVNDEAVLSSQN